MVLAAEGPPLTYFRAAMVVGEGSESFRTLFHLVKRLPVMIAPAWLRDAHAADRHRRRDRLPARGADRGRAREVQIGGPDVLSYGDMLGVVARVLGRREPPMLPVPLLTPRLSSLWIGLVTPVDAGVARPLVEGLSTETVVTDPSGAALFDVDPTPFAETARCARRCAGSAVRARAPPAARAARRARVRVLRRRAQPRGDHAAVARVRGARRPGDRDAPRAR